DLANTLNPLPSGTESIPQSPALPWEVIEKAIDLCSDDNTTLCAFALTCSQLHPRSLFVLYTKVDLRSTNQLIKFHDAVRAQPHLQPVVRSLSFPWEDFSSFPLLSILPCLRHITFDRMSPVFWNISLSESILLHGRQSVTSLQSLTIRSALFHTESAFLNFISDF
ncbi:hypothetical protein BD311DRAFT_597453, partial [Dichomitus squalens]